MNKITLNFFRFLYKILKINLLLCIFLKNFIFFKNIGFYKLFIKLNYIYFYFFYRYFYFYLNNLNFFKINFLNINYFNKKLFFLNFKKILFYKINFKLKNIFLNFHEINFFNKQKFFLLKNYYIFNIFFIFYKNNYLLDNKKNIKLNFLKFFKINFVFNTTCYISFFKNKFINYYNLLFFNKIKTFKNIFIYKNIFKSFNFIKKNNLFFLNKNLFLLNINLLDFSKFGFNYLVNLINIYNNHFPIVFFKKYNDIIFIKFNSQKKNNFLNLFNLYFLNFFEFFFKKKVFFKISNVLQKQKNYQISLFLKNFNNFKLQSFFDFNEMVEVICITFIYKDLIFFKNWLIVSLNNINIKNHKKFFVVLSDFIDDNFSYFYNFFKISGFYFCVRGKIGLSGNAKKKRFFFKKGFLKISYKNLKIDNQRFNIKTNCGSLGINMILSY